MPRIFRFPAERGWLELDRAKATQSTDAKDQTKSRLYPPQQVANRWEGPGGLHVLYELKTGDFALVEFTAAGEFVSGQQILRKGSGEAVKAFFEVHDLIMPWHLSE